MPESNEPSVTQPVAGEAQSESANAARSETESSVSQNVVPPNLVEIYRILKPVVSPIEEEETDETDETVDDESTPVEEQVTEHITPDKQEQNTQKKEPLLSEQIYKELRKAGNGGDINEAGSVVHPARTGHGS